MKTWHDTPWAAALHTLRCARCAALRCAAAELTEKKRVIDKHTNLATALLKDIKARHLDK